MSLQIYIQLECGMLIPQQAYQALERFLVCWRN